MIILVVTIIGASLLYKYIFQIKFEFAPILVSSSLSCFTLVLGTIGVIGIGLAIFIIFGAIGWLLFIYCFLRKKKIDKKEVSIAVIFSVIIGLIYLLFSGHYLYYYDDFTHWGAVVKLLLYNDRLPAISDTIIFHKSYPPGVACFIYLCCKIANDYSDGMMMASHMILMMSAVLPLLSMSGRKKLFYFPIIVGVITILTMNVSIQNLYTDNILPLFCLAGMIMIWYYRNELNVKWAIFIPVISMLLITKTAGIYYFLIDIVFLFYFLKKKKIDIKKFLLVLFASITAFLVWWIYLRVVDPDAMTSRHSISIKNMWHVFRMKGVPGNLNTIKEYIAKFSDFNSMKEFLGISILMMFLLFPVLHACRLEIKRILGLICIIYISYIIGLLGMYLFSMPEGTTGSFERYEKTIHILILGILIFFIQIIGSNNLIKQGYLLYCSILILFFCVLFAHPVDMVYFDKEKDSDGRLLSEIAQEHVNEIGAIYTSNEKERWEKSGAEIQYYLYNKNNQHNENNRMITNYVTGEYSLDDWKEWADYLLVLRPDAFYHTYAKMKGYDPAELLILNDRRNYP